MHFQRSRRWEIPAYFSLKDFSLVFWSQTFLFQPFLFKFLTFSTFIFKFCRFYAAGADQMQPRTLPWINLWNNCYVNIDWDTKRSGKMCQSTMYWLAQFKCDGDLFVEESIGAGRLQLKEKKEEDHHLQPSNMIKKFVFVLYWSRNLLQFFCTIR